MSEEFEKMNFKFRKGYLYTKSHEWIKKEHGKYKMGITDYAQKMLKDIVYVEFSEDEEFNKGDSLATLESVKAVGDVYAPFPCKVVEFNEALEDSPELVNKDPFGEGWVAILEPTGDVNEDEFLDVDKYVEHVEKESAAH